MGTPTGCWTLSTSESPSAAVASTLSDILEPPGPHLARYCLSPRAALGILRRAERRGRVLPAALREALENLAGAGASPPSPGPSEP
jgi:DNA (cytosine-5)-methyltransferase 1